jgi:hypothetical protein
VTMLLKRESLLDMSYASATTAFGYLHECLLFVNLESSLEMPTRVDQSSEFSLRLVDLIKQ